MISKRKLKQGESYISYHPQIPEEIKLSKLHFNQLWEMHPQEKPKIKIFGKEIECPRWFKNYGRDYTFSGINHKSEDIPPIIKKYLDYVNSTEHEYNYNGVLVNWYEDGSHYIGKHSDNEKSLVEKAPIYCFSFGSERRFILENENEKYKYQLLNNSLIIMGGECQKYYKHSIPKTKKKIDRRISITLREFKNI